MVDLTTTFASFAKIMVLAIQIIYTLFAFMLTQQIKIMNRNFKTGLAGYFAGLALVHFMAAVIVVVLSFLAF